MILLILTLACFITGGWLGMLLLALCVSARDAEEPPARREQARP